ncbi:MAG: DUF4089 domain-containing protein [Caldimonas sp.]
MERHEIEAYVDAAAASLALPIAAEHRQGVVHYVELAASMAALVMAFPLGIDDEAAPVFTPIAPGDIADALPVAPP